MQLQEIVGQNKVNSDVEITGLALDSRKVKPGFLFAALPGAHESGENYIHDALKRGAVAVLMSKPNTEVLGKAIFIYEDNPKQALAHIASRFFSPQPKIVAAVTGTNGKTSTVHFIRQIWEMLGYKAASIGTLGIMSAHKNVSTGLTSPDPILLHQTLKNLNGQGIERVAVEASSHGLHQYRLDGVKITIAAFTNLTHDHLDYHGGEENYFASKARLFSELLCEGGTAVINVTAPFGGKMLNIAHKRKLHVITVGQSEDCNFRIISSDIHDQGQTFVFEYQGQSRRFEFSAIGAFQVENLLVASACAIASGCPADEVFSVFPKLSSVPGRLELIGVTPSGGKIYIDYAHTPDGLKKALTAIRLYTKNKLYIVFGCGGDRDKSKRPAMGAIAAKLADVVIVTDDNPRHEDPAFIRRAIINACPNAREHSSRAEGIAYSVRALKNGDVLIVTGKGTETGQIVGDQVLPFSDAQEIRKVIDGLRAGTS